MLCSPRHAGRSIAAIALDAGFGDLSHFNRRFKQRFLMTPSEWRHHGTDGPTPADAQSLRPR